MKKIAPQLKTGGRVVYLKKDIPEAAFALKSEKARQQVGIDLKTIIYMDHSN